MNVTDVLYVFRLYHELEGESFIVKPNVFKVSRFVRLIAFVSITPFISIFTFPLGYEVVASND